MLALLPHRPLLGILSLCLLSSCAGRATSSAENEEVKGRGGHSAPIGGGHGGGGSGTVEPSSGGAAWMGGASGADSGGADSSGGAHTSGGSGGTPSCRDLPGLPIEESVEGLAAGCIAPALQPDVVLRLLMPSETCTDATSGADYRKCFPGTDVHLIEALPGGGTLVSGRHLIPFDGPEGPKSPVCAQTLGTGDWFVAELGADGSCLWSSWFGDRIGQKSSHLVPKSLTRDRAGNIVLTGAHIGPVSLYGTLLPAELNYHQAFALGFSPSGELRWLKPLRPNLPEGRVADVGATFDNDGDVYLWTDVGTAPELDGVKVNVGPNPSSVVTRLASDGTPKWARSYEGQLGPGVVGHGRLVFGGLDAGAICGGGAYGITLLTMNLDGEPLWSRSFDSESTQMLTSLALVPNGNIVVGGFASSDVDFGDGPLHGQYAGQPFVAEFDQYGNHLKSRMFFQTDAGSFDKAFINNVAVDAAGHILASGCSPKPIDLGAGLSAPPSTGTSDIPCFVLLLDSELNHLASVASPNLGTAMSLGCDGSLTVRGNTGEDFLAHLGM